MSIKMLLAVLLCLMIISTNLNATEDDFLAVTKDKTAQVSQKLFDKQEYDCLRSILWHEARNQPSRGIKAVLSVVMNRKQHPDYPGTYCKIEKQPWQFSYVKQGKSKINPKPTEEKKLDEISELAYDAVVGDFKPTLPEDVLHYARKDIENSWTKQKKVYTIIQDHKFYQTKGRI